MHCRYDVCTCIVCRYDRLCSVLLYVAYVSFDVHGVCDVRCMMYIHMWYTTYSDTGSLPTAHMGLFSLSVANHQFYSYNCAPTGMRIYSFLSTCMHAYKITSFMHSVCMQLYHSRMRTCIAIACAHTSLHPYVIPSMHASMGVTPDASTG